MTTTPTTTPARPVRNLTMKANPIDATVANSGVTAAINAFKLAGPYLGTGMPMWVTTSTAPEDYRDALEALVYAVQRAKQDRDRTPEAQWRSIDALVSAWRTSAEERIARAEAQVTRWDADLTARAMPPAPIEDRGDLEAALANARADARMVLDGATDEEVPARLGEMARSGDAVLAYLVLGSWPAQYFRGRGLTYAPIAWLHEREQVLGGILTDDALKAHRRLPGLPHARKAVIALRFAHSLTIANDPDHFGVGGDSPA